MFRRVSRAWRYTLTLGKAIFHRPQRTLLRRMVNFSRALPHRFNQPLPVMMADLTPTSSNSPQLNVDQIRRLADAVAAWHLRSPLGICLRRSLLRYHFLREANLPITIVFGARFKTEAEDGEIGGHAWLTLDGKPYYENPQDYQGFVEMFIYPAEE